MDAELGGVKVKDGVAVAQFFAKGIVPAHGVDLLARVLGHIGHLVEHLPPAQRQVAAGNIQAGHQQVTAGGRLRQVDDLPHIPGVDVGAGQQQAGLRQAAAAFVHRDRGHIGPGLHGRDRQPAAKVKVGAVSFVGQAQHAGVVRHAHNGAQVAADAVVGGVVHKHRHGAGVLGNGFGHLFAPHAQADAQAAVNLGVDVHRHRAAQHQRVEHAAVDVARQDDLIPAFAGGQHHALYRAGGAAHHQKGVRRAKGVGGQFLRFADDRDRVAEVVQRFHAVDVHPHALLAQKGRQFGVAAAVFVARHVKRHHPHAAEIFQRFMDRRAPLVQPGAAFVCVHGFAHPFGVAPPNKKRKPPYRQACVRNAYRGPAQRPHRGRAGKSKADRVQSLYSNSTFTTLIDRFTSLRGRHAISGYKGTNL